ncbi:DUF3237 family protein [Dongia sp. agr-C8]
MLTPGFDYIATFEIDVGPALEAGPGCRVIPVIGGRVRGPRLSGTILAGGTDWQNDVADDTVRIGGRWILETDDLVRLQVETPGIRQADPQVLAALRSGRDVDPASYYFRVAPQFVVADPAYAWLQRAVFVGTGAKRRQGVAIDVFTVT